MPRLKPAASRMRATHLRMSQSAVSRQVSALERDLNVPLFHRHARGLVLTEQGELLFDTAKVVMNKLHTAETLLSDAKTKPAGELRITCPVGFGTVWVTQRMPRVHGSLSGYPRRAAA